ncbi:MAG: hypothetical protein II738_01335 [Clostridia bacterium]|nr:hypothetical protein [Clostridia bacterium]
MNTRFSGGNLNPRVVLIAAVVLVVALVSVVGNALLKNNAPVPTTAPPPATVTVPETATEATTTEPSSTELPPVIDPYARAIETDADGNTLTVPESADTYFYDRPADERPNLDGSGTTAPAGENDPAPATDETYFYDRPAQERQVAERTTQAPSRPYISPSKTLQFRNEKYLEEHYQKHGRQVGAVSKEDYVQMAAAVIRSGDAQIRNQVDGDTAYYIPATREFAVLSGDGYIRTYFLASQDYFDRQ